MVPLMSECRECKVKYPTPLGGKGGNASAFWGLHRGHRYLSCRYWIFHILYGGWDIPLRYASLSNHTSAVKHQNGRRRLWGASSPAASSRLEAWQHIEYCHLILILLLCGIKWKSKFLSHCKILQRVCNQQLLDAIISLVPGTELRAVGGAGCMFWGKTFKPSIILMGGLRRFVPGTKLTRMGSDALASSAARTVWERG